MGIKDNPIMRPGLAAVIVDQERHMKSMIYDVIDRRIIIAQTVPPLTKFSLKQRVILTFLVRTDGLPSRYGINAEVTDIIKDYELVSTTVFAIGLLQKGEIEKYDLRFDFRTRPPAASGIEIVWRKKALNIIDISLGGMKFSYREDDCPAVNVEIKLTMEIDGLQIPVSAMVQRVTTPSPNDSNVHHVQVQFTAGRQMYEQPLMRKTIEIQRKLIADGMLL
jgi:hypothetical protein